MRYAKSVYMWLDNGAWHEAKLQRKDTAINEVKLQTKIGQTTPENQKMLDIWWNYRWEWKDFVLVTTSEFFFFQNNQSQLSIPNYKVLRKNKFLPAVYEQSMACLPHDWNELVHDATRHASKLMLRLLTSQYLVRHRCLSICLSHDLFQERIGGNLHRCWTTNSTP